MDLFTVRQQRQYIKMANHYLAHEQLAQAVEKTLIVLDTILLHAERTAVAAEAQLKHDEAMLALDGDQKRQ